MFEVNSMVTMMSKMGLRPGQRFGTWELSELLGAGGNGEAWTCTGPAGETVVIKLLRRVDKQHYDRFKDEVAALSMLKGVAGVIPIVDTSLPSEITKAAPAWFVMPLATALAEHLDAADLDTIVRAVAMLAETLTSLAARGISHRDIKPENLFWYEDRPTLGDFGLVSFPDKARITGPLERLGPIYYLAPEMLLDAANSDGRPADVYSLAKTLWVLVTGQRHPFAGELRVDVPALRLSTYAPVAGGSQLDLLIERATRHSAEDRPTMAEFAAELAAWLHPRPGAHVTDDLTDLAERIAAATAPAQREKERRMQYQHLAREMFTRLDGFMQEYVRVLAAAAPCDGKVHRDDYLYREVTSRPSFGDPTSIWRAGAYVEAKIPALRFAVLQCGVAVDLFDDGTCVLHAEHAVGQGFANGQILWHPLWHGTSQAQVGTAEQDQDCGELFAGMNTNLRTSLLAFAEFAESMR
jgi:serine/threonine protein kinase